MPKFQHRLHRVSPFFGEEDEHHGDIIQVGELVLMCLRGEIILCRDPKSEEHEERAPAIFPPAMLIFGLPTQKIC